MNRLLLVLWLLLFAPTAALADLAPWPAKRGPGPGGSKDQELILLIAGVLLAVCIAVVGILRLRRGAKSSTQPPSESQP